MFGFIVKKIAGSRNDRLVKKIWPIVAQINAHEAELQKLPEEALQAHPALGFDHGLVHEVAGRHMQGKYQNVRAYLAGPPPAVDASIRMLLLQAKLTADNIRYDKFS